MSIFVEHLKTFTSGSNNLDKVLVTVDTESEKPDPAEHPNWAPSSELVVLENGGAKYRLSNAGEWVKVNFDVGGGGNGESTDIPEFKMLDDGAGIAVGRVLSGQNVGFPIAGHDAFYQPYGYGTIMKIPFDTGEQEQFPAVCPENPQCWITQMAYGNGIYFGVDTTNGRAYRSEDAVNWEIVYSFQIDPATVTSISFSDGDFFFGTSTGAIGAALKSENYNRVTDYSSYYPEVVDAGTLQAVYNHFGNHFFVTDACIVSGHLGGGEIRRLAFLEEAPDDPYLASTIAFWNNHLVMFNEIERLIYVIPMRYPHDTAGNFIDPEWRFFCNDDWQNEVNPVGVSEYGDYLIVYCDRNIYCIDTKGNISQMNPVDVPMIGDIAHVVTVGKTILVCKDTMAYQFFIK